MEEVESLRKKYESKYAQDCKAERAVSKELSPVSYTHLDAVLAECTVRDCIWGIGLSMTDPKRLELEKWRGQNLLGFALMMVRDGI